MWSLPRAGTGNWARSRATTFSPSRCLEGIERAKLFHHSCVTTATQMKATTEQAPVLSNEGTSFFADGMLVVLFLAFANFLLHLYFNNQYGYFRDEFDYMACGDHLAWGYVDHPPLVPFLVKISRLVLGDSLRSIRFIPALATSAAVILTAMMARELGGRRFAVVLSALAFIAVPIYLNDGSVMTTNCLEPLLWMGCVYFAMLAIKRHDPRYWLWFGIVAGIGLEEKYSIAVLGFGIVVGLLLAEQRRVFTRKWIWLGGALAFLVFLPNFLWNVQNHWPFAQLMHNIKADGRDVVLSPAAYFAQQILIVHPILAPIWITGLLGSRRGGDREFHRTIAPSLAEARGRSVGSRRRSLARASCPAGTPR